MPDKLISEMKIEILLLFLSNNYDPTGPEIKTIEVKSIFHLYFPLGGRIEGFMHRINYYIR